MTVGTSIRPALALLLLLAAWCAAAQTVYKWTDASGRVHYTNGKPPAGVPFTTLGPPPAPDAEAASQARARTQRQLDDLSRADAARREQAQRDLQAESERGKLAQRQQRCAAARHDLQLLQRGGPVFHYDERGQRVYLPDAQRDAEVASLQKAVAEWCSGVAAAPPASGPSARSACAAAREALADLSAPGARAVGSDLTAARQRVERTCAGQP